MIYDRSKSCCFTGHRIIPRAEVSTIRGRTALAVLALYHEGYRAFIAGGALGFDTIAAEIVLALKEKYPDILLVLVLPSADQASRWHAAERAHYDAIKERADEVICLAPQYYDGCMQARNRRMVEMSGACIAYMTRPHSGAGQTVRMAEKAGLPVTTVASVKL